MDLSRAELSRHAGPSAQVRYFAVHPGTVDPSISAALDSSPLIYVKIFMFYPVRFSTKCVSVSGSTKVGGFSRRPGGSAICTTTFLHGMAPPLPFTYASLCLRLFRSCGCEPYRNGIRPYKYGYLTVAGQAEPVPYRAINFMLRYGTGAYTAGNGHTDRHLHLFFMQRARLGIHVRNR
jgi:hypothetical protein